MEGTVHADAKSRGQTMLAKNPVLIIGIVGTLLAAVATRLYQSGGATKATEPAQLRAAVNLKKGARLELANFAGSGLVGRLNPDEEKLTEKFIGLVLVRDIPAKAVIAAEDARTPPPTRFAGDLPAGLRGLPLRLNPLALGSPDLLNPGDYVDVLGQRSEGKGTEMVADRALVLQRLEAAATEGKEGPAGELELVLGVTPEQAIRICEAEKAGGIRLLLRSPQDLGAAPRVAANASPKPPVVDPPAKIRYPPPKKDPTWEDATVDVYVVKGSTLETVNVPK